MKIKSLILVSIALSGCSLFTNKKVDYSDSYVTGVGLKSSSLLAIQKNLTRSFSMAGGNYNIKAYPLTKAYLAALSKETAMLKNLNNEQSKELKRRIFDQFSNSKTCLNLSINVQEFERVNKLSKWQLTLIDSNNIQYPLVWIHDKSKLPPYGYPITTVGQSYHGKQKRWSLNSKACASKEIDITLGFKLIVKPSFVQWPFPSTTEEVWSFNRYIVEDGKKVLKKRKKKYTKKYRGW